MIVIKSVYKLAAFICNFYFCDEFIAPKFFTKNIKLGRTCKELLEDIAALVEKSGITKKLQDNPKLVV